MQLDRDGKVTVLLTDGHGFTWSLGRPMFEPTSAIESSTYLPRSAQLRVRTTRGDDIVVDLPHPDDLAPLRGRPTIYLDQNHWSTIASTLYEPDRAAKINKEEREAATRLVRLATRREVVLPISGAHIAETCKQVNVERRYLRALTITRLSAGWQLRDPLSLRGFELRQALTIRYRQVCLIRPAPITLEPHAIHDGRDMAQPNLRDDLPLDAQWAVKSIESIGATIDTMLDADHVPMTSNPAWALEFEHFARFMADNPTGPELKRQRTHARFIADMLPELTRETFSVGITPDEMSEWTRYLSEEDLHNMPSLGLYREIIHEKLSDGRLHWDNNDLFDMLYLTAGAGYCDYVVGENKHISHIANGLRRLGRPVKVYRNLRSMIAELC
ncbi:MAG TPA: hypothetical protein VFW65_12195 [Pseudonocardiaceae bacterium]|nr:hypothetical protein [Pseudonocardiaceae bacterium]